MPDVTVPLFLLFLLSRFPIEASNSITDEARGLVSEREDTAMRELFFHLNKKFRNMIKKTSFFFIIEENRIFFMYEINRFFTINSLFFVQIGPE